MRNSNWNRRFSRRPLALPLLLPLLLPLSTQLSIRLTIEGGYVYLIYLPLARDIERALSAYDLQPWQLIIQVSDSPVLDQGHGERRSITPLMQLGCCRVIITDFGGKFAGFSRLKELEGDMLKIDASFIRTMLEDSLAYQVVAAICALAKSKRLRVVASGVDSPESGEGLRQPGIDYLQGKQMAPTQPLEAVIQASGEFSTGLRAP